MNFFGVLTTASCTALGGGTVREMILHGTPSYLLDYRYAVVVLFGSAFTIALIRHFRRVNVAILALDAVGTVTFAFIGADRAHQSGLGTGAMILCAVLTAVGGGILSDVLVGRRPEALHSEFAIVPACAVAVLSRIFADQLDRPATIPLILVAAFGLRAAGLARGWRVWRPARARAAEDLRTNTARAGATWIGMQRTVPLALLRAADTPARKDTRHAAAWSDR